MSANPQLVAYDGPHTAMVLGRRDLISLGSAAAVSLACHRGGGSAPPETTPRKSESPARRFTELEGFCSGVPSVDATELEDRRQRLSHAMEAADLDVFVAEAGTNFSYLTGAHWGKSERPLLYAWTRQGQAIWVAPAFEQHTLRERMQSSDELRLWKEFESPAHVLFAALQAHKLKHARIGIDPQMRRFVAQPIEALAEKLGDGTAVIRAARIQKTGRELARLRRANEATKASLRLASQHIREGMTQREFAEIVRSAQSSAGLSDIWVLALFGPNAAFPHGTAHDRPLQKGDIVLVDTGGSLHGYCSDITRSWAPLGLDRTRAHAFETVLAAQSAALAKIKPGVRCGDVDEAARAVMAKAGYGPHDQRFTHRLGHGIGIDVHEAPYLVARSEEVLDVGMTMSDEPGIYVPGEFGIRIEDILAVTDHGSEVFGPRTQSLELPFG